MFVRAAHFNVRIEESLAVHDFESVFRRSPVSVGTTSPDLLEASQRGDAAAWEELVTTYSPLVYSWSRLSGLAPEDAKDAVQNVMRAVYSSLEGFDPDQEEASFRGWLRTITKYKIVDLRRREANEPNAVGGTEAQRGMAEIRDLATSLSQLNSAEMSGRQKDEPSSDSSPLQLILEKIRRDYSDRTWRAFWGMAVENRESPDIAAELEMSSAAVRLAKARVLKRLRDELNY